MWRKSLIVIILIYFFALLQNSFFTHFSLFGTVPNLVFALFFILAFFEKKNNNYRLLLWALIAGFFLDIFSYTYIGPSIISLVIIGILLKNTQSLLKIRDEDYPFVYFLPLFITFLLIHELLMGLYLYFLDPNKIITSFDIKTIFYVIYSSIFATIFFFIYKRNFSKLHKW